MDFIEQIFGFSPDGGSGWFNFCCSSFPWLELPSSYPAPGPGAAQLDANSRCASAYSVPLMEPNAKAALNRGNEWRFGGFRFPAMKRPTARDYWHTAWGSQSRFRRGRL